MNDKPDTPPPSPEDKPEITGDTPQSQPEAAGGTPAPGSPPPAPPEDAAPPPAPAEGSSPPPAPATAGGGSGDLDEKQWAMFRHLSQLLNFMWPLGLVAPIVIWQIKKDKFPSLDAHGKMVTNWQISAFIYGVALAVLTCWLGGLGALVVLIMCLAYAIIGGVKANDGILWDYPLTIKFIK